MFITVALDRLKTLEDSLRKIFSLSLFLSLFITFLLSTFISKTTLLQKYYENKGKIS